MARSLVIVFIGVCTFASVFAAIILVYFLTYSTNIESSDWAAFKKLYNISYINKGEESYRKTVFLKNQRMIELHNERYDAGEFSYKLKINQFGDTTSDEYLKSYMDFNHTSISMRYSLVSTINTKKNKAKIPDAVDWREKGYVTPVRDQGLVCDSSWAFSAAGALEGQYFKKTGVLETLSVQELMDCTVDYGYIGCGGQSIEEAFQYAKDHETLKTEAEYPYGARNKNCSRSKQEISRQKLHLRGDIRSNDFMIFQETSSVSASWGNENQLKAEVARAGPISTRIDASNDTFRFYSEGIYFQPVCNNRDTQHAVLIVGYGTDSKNRDFWLVKNSYGKTWGENGYFKIARNKNNSCGIATYAAYPIV